MYIVSPRCIHDKYISVAQQSGQKISSINQPVKANKKVTANIRISQLLANSATTVRSYQCYRSRTLLSRTSVKQRCASMISNSILFLTSSYGPSNHISMFHPIEYSLITKSTSKHSKKNCHT
jgi:hypothetical protein